MSPALSQTFVPLPFPPIAWMPGEVAALTLPAGLTVSEWAAAHRVLPKATQFSGAWSNRLAPYTVAVMDAFTDPLVEQITIMASIQSSKTEAAYNMLGYAISQDPAPALLVMPTEKLLRKANRRLRSMLRLSPDLARHLTGNPDDLRMEALSLDLMDLHFATAGSEADLQFVEARNLVLDETDIYPPGAVKMATDRTTTFFNRKIVVISRPTAPEGHINIEWLKSDQRRFWVPCPHCGGYQVLEFERLKHRGAECGQWPREAGSRDRDQIIDRRLTVYECRYCAAEIEPVQKAEMLLQGKWAPKDWPISREGELAPPPPVRHVGFHWDVLVSPFRTWDEVMAEWFSVKENPAERRNFINQWLARVWKEVAQVRKPCVLIEGEAALTTVRPALEVPDNTVALTLGADNHKRGIAAAVWAWERLSPKVYNQHLIRYGWLADFKELEGWIFEDVYHNQAGSLDYRIWRAALDTGGGEGYSGDATLTTQAYEWLRRWGHLGRVFGIKGASGRLKSGKHLEYSPRDKMPGGKPIPGGLKLFILDTHALKDDFWARVEMGRVHLHVGTGEDFARELTAEAKEYDQRRKQWLWAQQGNKPNHYLDATIYANAMADPELVGLEVMAVPEVIKTAAETEAGINSVTGLPWGAFMR